MRMDPLVSDITVVNELRALLYEALERKDEIDRNSKILDTLKTWEMGTTALVRLQKFITVAQHSPCSFAYPTILYKMAKNGVEKDTGYHFSVPPLLNIMKKHSFYNKDNTKISIEIPRLKLIQSQFDDAVEFINDKVEYAIDRNGKNLATILFRLAHPKRQHALAIDPVLNKWLQSNILALHTYAVADTCWDSDPKRLTPLQNAFVEKKLKFQNARPDSIQEAVPRGVAYLAAAKACNSGLCNSPARDNMIKLFNRSNWIEIVLDSVYSSKPLIKEFKSVLLNILADSTKKDSNLAKYCRSEVNVGRNNYPIIDGIDQYKIRILVNEWETMVWYKLLDQLLTRTDLRENRVEVLAYRVGEEIQRLAQTEVLRQACELLKNSLS